jgi:hypothetical protein
VSTDTAAATTIALKEWGAVVHALLQGRQTVLLRKGGVHEKAFTLPGGTAGSSTSGTAGANTSGTAGANTSGTAGTVRGGFVLFPTVAHSHRERVRDEHADLLEAGEADASDATLTLRAGVQLVEVIEVARPEALPQIADTHIWTDESVKTDRVDFRPRHALQALVVRAVELPEPVVLQRTEDHGGCRSWLELPSLWDGVSGTQAVGEDRLTADAERVRRTVG